MARTRTLTQLTAEVRQRADIEGATDRHPDANLTRYINQGAAALRDLIIEARGRAYFRSTTPTTITTTASTSRYALNAAFYRLISVRISTEPGGTLEPFDPQLEPLLRSSSSTSPWPTHYEIQPGYIELLPLHPAGVTVVVEYIPHLTDLSAGSDTFDGLNGWEEYIVAFAAKCVFLKDDERALAKDMQEDMDRLAVRIGKMAPKRDAFRAERVKDVRGGRAFMGPGWPWRFR